ncbi:hypothetical protein [Marinimicrobium locisalis]|uniref:hypothetical protein n=1 Tax=Marinimicrobium locisalis TaxID=546022 RepID=UPI003222139C
MSKFRATLLAALGFTGLVMAGPALAQVELDFSAGASFPSASDYDSDVFANTSLGYRMGDWSARAGYLSLGDFELDSDVADASITMRGPYMQAVRRFETRLLTWELGAGAARLESEAELSGRLLDEQSEWGAFVEVAGVRQLVDGFSLKGSYLYFNDRLGSDVSALAVGIRFSF